MAQPFRFVDVLVSRQSPEHELANAQDETDCSLASIAIAGAPMFGCKGLQKPPSFEQRLLLAFRWLAAVRLEADLRATPASRPKWKFVPCLALQERLAVRTGACAI
jgi:hypothetical protein